MNTGMAISLTPTSSNAPLLFSGHLEEGLKAAANLGFRGVELNILDPKDVDGVALKKLLRQHSLTACALATGQAFGRHGLSLSHAEADVRHKALERLRDHAHLATVLECPITIGLIRGVLPLDQALQEEARKRAIDGLAQFAAYAESLGLNLYLEPINRYETNFINTIAQGLEVIKEIGAKNVLLLADTFHMNIEEVDMAEALRSAGDRLGYMHFADSNRHAPGSGHTDFAPILAALRKMGYKGFLTVEILPLPDDFSAAQRSARFFQEHL